MNNLKELVQKQDPDPISTSLMDICYGLFTVEDAAAARALATSFPYAAHKSSSIHKASVFKLKAEALWPACPQAIWLEDGHGRPRAACPQAIWLEDGHGGPRAAEISRHSHKQNHR